MGFEITEELKNELRELVIPDKPKRWTDETTAILKYLHGEGYTENEIAGVLQQKFPNLTWCKKLIKSKISHMQDKGDIPKENNEKES